jgi:hypothetical protein
MKGQFTNFNNALKNEVTFYIFDWCKKFTKNINESQLKLSFFTCPSSISSESAGYPGGSETLSNTPFNSEVRNSSSNSNMDPTWNSDSAKLSS